VGLRAPYRSFSSFREIRGELPSDFPEIPEFLVEVGIDSITLNLDTAIDTTPRIPKIEARLDRTPS